MFSCFESAVRAALEHAGDARAAATDGRATCGLHPALATGIIILISYILLYTIEQSKDNITITVNNKLNYEVFIGIYEGKDDDFENSHIFLLYYCSQIF